DADLDVRRWVVGEAERQAWDPASEIGRLLRGAVGRPAIGRRERGPLRGEGSVHVPCLAQAPHPREARRDAVAHRRALPHLRHPAELLERLFVALFLLVFVGLLKELARGAEILLRYARLRPGAACGQRQRGREDEGGETR